jgi:aminopeptidase N
MNKRLFAFTVSIVISVITFAQLNPALDVQHYRFAIELNDSNNIIKGEAQITIKFLQDVNEVKLDLIQKRSDGKGMVVMNVKENENGASFSQDSQHIVINAAAKKGEAHVYSIIYEGEPADGLIISKNKFGRRTFFSDNWPNRAHNWLPCNDHPSDKASVEFIVTAPDHYQVISNGLKIEETNLQNHLKLTHWKEDVLLPVKILALGIADFAMNYAGDVDGIPIYSYVFPEEKENGFHDYGQAKEILPFFIKHVGPYAYKKLANVESKTLFNGMENANAIFYSENSIGDYRVEWLLAHEISHQWFGDAASEKDWPHLWLSEGFATYMTDLYLENKYGKETLNKRLQEQRDTVIVFAKRRFTPVVDETAANDLLQLLNPNSYEKGGWVLHMLRRKLGDSLFWKAIRTYYATYAGKNANTEDLRNVFEKLSHQNLRQFFKQWLYTLGHPKLNIEWKYNDAKKSVTIRIKQMQGNLFEFPLEIAFSDGNKTIVKSIEIKDKLTTKEIPLNIKPTRIIADPNVNLLFEAEISEWK